MNVPRTLELIDSRSGEILSFPLFAWADVFSGQFVKVQEDALDDVSKEDFTAEGEISLQHLLEMQFKGVGSEDDYATSKAQLSMAKRRTKRVIHRLVRNLLSEQALEDEEDEDEDEDEDEEVEEAEHLLATKFQSHQREQQFEVEE
jgi:hypothetical protein